MKRSFVLLFSSALIIMFFSIFYVKIHEQDQVSETTVLKSFDHSGAKVVSSEIYFWAKLDSSYRDSEKRKQLADSFANLLGVLKNEIYSEKAFDNDLVQKTETYGMLSDNRYVTIVTQTDRDSKGKTESHLSVTITQDLTSSGIDSAKQEVMKVFDKYRIEPKISTCITGYLDGQVGNERLNDICRQIFKEAEASKVEGVREKNLISVAAYSPMIEDYIRVNGRKVNLNLAIRYNSYEDKTYIWLATPVISIEY